MLTAAIASNDSSATAQVVACLEQTGIVASVKKWTIPNDKVDAAEMVPDIVLLDLGPEPEVWFTFGAHLRRVRPAVRLIACSAVNPPTPELLLDAMRSGVQDFVYKPVTTEALRVILERIRQEGPASEAKLSEKLIVVMGSKGGVGTTTVAVNLGVQFSTFARKRVVLLDLARPLGNAHLLLDLHPRFGIRDAIENIDRLDSHFFSGLLTVHRTKVELLGGALHPEQWQSVSPALLDRIANVAQTNSDLVVADIGSQFGSEWSSMLRASRTILLVAETDVPSIWTLERRLSALDGLGIPPKKIRIVINRWHKGDEETLNSIEKHIKRPIAGLIPNDFREASTSVNMGIPMIENHNNNLTSHYRKLVAGLVGPEPIPAAKKNSIRGLFSFRMKRMA
jgi:pilus assembly protein CpaE